VTGKKQAMPELTIFTAAAGAGPQTFIKAADCGDGRSAKCHVGTCTDAPYRRCLADGLSKKSRVILLNDKTRRQAAIVEFESESGFVD
jgi:hypothetical protein